MEIILKYWGIIVPILVLGWHVANNIFKFKVVISKQEQQEAEIKAHRKDIDAILITIASMPSIIENKLLAHTAEEDKQLALRIADQEKRNSDNDQAWIKMYAGIDKHMELMSQSMGGVKEDLRIISARTESMEKKDYEKLAKELEEYKRTHKKV